MKSLKIGVFFLLLSVQSWGMPAQVVLIRHGEKPFEGNGLSPQGVARANALPSFFKTNPVITHFGPIAAIYAMEPNPDDTSLRAIQTMTPTARALSVPLHAQFSKNQINLLVNEIRNTAAYQQRTVVICWEHKMIPLIVRAFGVRGAPETWDGEVFDRAWVLDFNPDGESSFRDIPEQVLPSDSH